MIENIFPIKYLNLLFIFKIDRIMTILNKYQETLIQRIRTNNLIDLMKLLGYVVMMGHFVASLFLFVAVYEMQNGEGLNWIEVKNLS